MNTRRQIFEMKLLLAFQDWLKYPNLPVGHIAITHKVSRRVLSEFITKKIASPLSKANA